MDDARRIPVSTILLTRNSAASLPRYFEMMKDIDDIILLDGGSTDDTIAIAIKQPNCRVMPQKKEFLDSDGYITDFSSMRNYGYTFARHPWILCIDADEYPDDALLASVREVALHGKVGVYYAQRVYTINGKRLVTLKRSSADHLRLFHTDVVKGCLRPMHERLDVAPGAYRGVLKGEIIVPLAPSSSLRRKYNRYLKIEVAWTRSQTNWRHWFKWIFIRNVISIVRRIGVAIVTRLIPRRGPRYPLRQDYELIRYLVLVTILTCPLLYRRAS